MKWGGNRRNLGVLLRVACRVSRHPRRGLTKGKVDEGILEVSELAEDRVVELRVFVELHGVGIITCEVGGIVQGDEGPLAESHRSLVMES